METSIQHEVVSNSAYESIASGNNSCLLLKGQFNVGDSVVIWTEDKAKSISKTVCYVTDEK